MRVVDVCASCQKPTEVSGNGKCEGCDPERWAEESKWISEFTQYEDLFPDLFPGFHKQVEENLRMKHGLQRLKVEVLMDRLQDALGFVHLVSIDVPVSR